MTDRITNRDLEGMFVRYVRACEALSLIPDGHSVVLQHGSKVNGIAFRVHGMRPDSGGAWHPPAGRDFLGMTKREAYDALADRAAVLEDVAWTQEKANQ